MELVQCKPADVALAELEMCPLVEIVHFHKVLRGEMVSLVQQYKQLRCVCHVLLRSGGAGSEGVLISFCPFLVATGKGWRRSHSRSR